MSAQVAQLPLNVNSGQAGERQTFIRLALAPPLIVQSVFFQRDVLVKASPCSFATALITATVLFGSSFSLNARVINEVSRAASLPVLVHSGVFNPFPALYVFDADRNLVLSVRGPTDDRFDSNFIANELDSGGKLADPLSDAQVALLWRYFPESQQPARKTAFFLTIDESMGKAELINQRLEIVRDGLEKAKVEVVLVVIRAGN
ncbi:hypothetical protein [Silanimonas sp.]|uniref:hypothetical protein n=1 Tax=Silanimonas sp. TaxID=1929290 RepID=UPI001BBD37DD|nr:hypothetical protein [Silanimonas sp.]MBS3896134.1 hypothetical protein [Silanimonas sp.]MBS3923816.1 hypothetical protein [Xanthomonadaceae bacterium]